MPRTWAAQIAAGAQAPELAVPRGSGGGGGGGGCGGGASTNMPCTRCSAKVKQEKDGVGEQLAGKDELYGMSSLAPAIN